jgi:hypothetical protein
MASYRVYRWMNIAKWKEWVSDASKKSHRLRQTMSAVIPNFSIAGRIES